MDGVFRIEPVSEQSDDAKVDQEDGYRGREDREAVDAECDLLRKGEHRKDSTQKGVKWRAGWMGHAQDVGGRDEFTRIPKRDRWCNGSDIDEKREEEYEGGNDAISLLEGGYHTRDLR